MWASSSSAGSKRGHIQVAAGARVRIKDHFHIQIALDKGDSTPDPFPTQPDFAKRGFYLSELPAPLASGKH